jgi:methyltransferase
MLRVLFSALVLAVATQRLWELGRSRQNEVALRARGAREHAPQQMPVMRAVHAAWLVGMLVEVWALDRTPSPWIAVPALGAFLVGQALRIAAMRALGERWNVKILTLPGEPPISGGVFSYVRHPNYLGVVLEMAALPLIGGAFVTAIVASVANGLLLAVRIRAEEAALHEDNHYAALSDRPLFLPRPSRRA